MCLPTPQNRGSLACVATRLPEINYTMKHVAAYVLILLGIYLFGRAAYDEHRGMTHPSTRYSSRIIVKRAEDPQRFRNEMIFHWFRASVVMCAGFVVLGFSRRAERSDPLSPDFAGNSAIDELNDELTKEQEKRRRPLR